MSETRECRDCEHCTNRSDDGGAFPRCRGFDRRQPEGDYARAPWRHSDRLACDRFERREEWPITTEIHPHHVVVLYRRAIDAGSETDGVRELTSVLRSLTLTAKPPRQLTREEGGELVRAYMHGSDLWEASPKSLDRVMAYLAELNPQPAQEELTREEVANLVVAVLMGDAADDAMVDRAMAHLRERREARP